MIDHRTNFSVSPVENLPKHARKPKLKGSTPRLAGMVGTSSRAAVAEQPERIQYDRPRKFVSFLTLDNENKAGRYWK